jgi:hypothetical protein
MRSSPHANVICDVFLRLSFRPAIEWRPNIEVYFETRRQELWPEAAIY